MPVDWFDFGAASFASRTERQLLGKTGPAGRFSLLQKTLSAVSMLNWRSMDQNTKDILDTVNFIKDRC